MEAGGAGLEGQRIFVPSGRMGEGWGRRRSSPVSRLTWLPGEGGFIEAGS